MSRPGAVMALILAVGILSACGSPAAEQNAPVVLADSVLSDMVPREDVTYYESGIHASGDTSVAVGILRYRALGDEVGEWILVSRDSTPTTFAADLLPFARLMGSEGFDRDLWPLDGHYVAAEGTAVSEQDGVCDLEINALSAVFDLYPSGTTTHHEPGLHQMYDGRKVVVGWVAGTDNGTTTLTDASPQEGGGTVVALIRKAGKGPPDGVYFDTQVRIIESEPVLIVEAVGGGGGYSTQKPLRMFPDASAEWYSIERYGIKDLPGGRHRIVGMLVGDGEMLDDPTRPQIMLSNPQIMRFSYPYQPALIGLDDPDGLVDMSADPMRDQPYVAVEGFLSVAGMRLSVDQFELIPTPRQATLVTPEPE